MLKEQSEKNLLLELAEKKSRDENADLLLKIKNLESSFLIIYLLINNLIYYIT